MYWEEMRLMINLENVKVGIDCLERGEMVHGGRGMRVHAAIFGADQNSLDFYKR